MSDRISKTGFRGALPLLSGGMAVLLALYGLLPISELLSVPFNDEGYPWGAACAPWYYETKEVYLLHAALLLLCIAAQVTLLIRATRRNEMQQQRLAWISVAIFVGLHFAGVFGGGC